MGKLLQAIINEDYVGANKLFESAMSDIKEQKLYEVKRSLGEEDILRRKWPKPDSEPVDAKTTGMVKNTDRLTKKDISLRRAAGFVNAKELYKKSTTTRPSAKLRAGKLLGKSIGTMISGRDENGNRRSRLHAAERIPGLAAATVSRALSPTTPAGYTARAIVKGTGKIARGVAKGVSGFNSYMSQTTEETIEENIGFMTPKKRRIVRKRGKPRKNKYHIPGSETSKIQTSTSTGIGLHE